MVLNSVLCDETVPERIVRHIVLNADGVGSVDDDASLEGVSDDVVFHDATANVAAFVKVNGLCVKYGESQGGVMRSRGEISFAPTNKTQTIYGGFARET